MNDLARLLAKVEHQENGCWSFTGYRDRAGYGRFSMGRTRAGALAHRVGYELLVGPIPDDLTVDHLCRNKACVNPEHLELVTLTENNRRGFSPTAINGRKTHCVNGHEFTPENTRHDHKGYRHCRSCDRAWEARRARRGA